MPRPRNARDGEEIVPSKSGFPIFFRKRQNRVLTSNVWSLLSSLSERYLEEAENADAQAYLEQAQEFFTAASSPRIRSKPLLYYYAYLNLAKVFLLHRGRTVPPTAKHGMTETTLNIRNRVRLQGMRVRIFPRNPNQFNLAAEFIHELGEDNVPPIMWIVDLISQLPSIHRTWVRAGDADPLLCPANFTVLKDGVDLWARVAVDTTDDDVVRTIPVVRNRRRFRTCLRHVTAGADDQLWFDTATETGRRRGVDNAILRLARHVAPLSPGFLLTTEGYRYYLPAHEPSIRLPQLAASLVVMYYLGNVTRYRPADYSKIFHKNAWLIGDLLQNEPTQFLYGLASYVAGVDVVVPLAVTKSQVD